MMEKTALLVGASRGLGLGLAQELSSRDWRVIATSRSGKSPQPLRDWADAQRGRAQLESIDVDRAEDLDALATRLVGRRLDLLFLNAGISGPPGVTAYDTTRDALAQVLWTNAIAPLRIAQRLLPLLATGGKIAFMSSAMGSIAENSFGGHDLYRVSKVALNMLTRNFALAIPAERRIAVLSLHPGWVRTDMGGPDAPLDIGTSVRGLADVVEAAQPATHRFLDYTGREIPW